MATLHSMISDPDVVVGLEPEQLAGVLLAFLNALQPNEQHQINRHNFFNTGSYGSNAFVGYPPSRVESVAEAYLEAWIWLEREGLLIPKVTDLGQGYKISRRGQRIKTRDDLNAYQRAAALPRARASTPRSPTKYSPPS
jgi:hypothetical protein